MSVTDDELAADAEAAPGHNALGSLAPLIIDWKDKQRELADMDEQMKALKKDIQHLEQGQIPDAMLEIGLDKIELTDGTKVIVKPIVEGSIPKKNQPAASAYLRGLGAGDIIKNVITMAFSAGHDKEVAALAKRLEGDGYAPTVVESVHVSTLKSWALEQIQAGKELDLKLLGLFHGRKAKITLPKS